MIKKLVSHLGEYKRAAVLTPLFAALEAVMDVLLPTIMAFIIDQGIEKGDMNAILKYGLLTFLVAVVALALGVGNGDKKKMIHREYSFGYDVVSLSIHARDPKGERKFAEI
jgi:ABC-type multidrug transport system fused ATPase/permease subunit